jgi:hypothetical protein
MTPNFGYNCHLNRFSIENSSSQVFLNSWNLHVLRACPEKLGFTDGDDEQIASVFNL